ncbi:transcriptional regulator domain-containing protein [Labrys sp. 22185]|uniref:transcriptional regulator domain-containing protein n=1 Tax=Labrys sp. 22185 TaxID=3453888 RepID=UPI003F86B36C
MMLRIGWRSSVAYRHMDGVSAASFAWQYVRRDEEYRRDFQNLKHSAASQLEAFSQRWGLRFPA